MLTREADDHADFAGLAGDLSTTSKTPWTTMRTRQRLVE
jgi:hypothetical protein